MPVLDLSFLMGKIQDISDVPFESIESLSLQGCATWGYTSCGIQRYCRRIFERDEGHIHCDMNQYVYSCSHILLLVQIAHCIWQVWMMLVRIKCLKVFVDCWPGTPIPNHLRPILEKDKEMCSWEDCDGVPVSMAAKFARQSTLQASHGSTHSRVIEEGVQGKGNSYLTA